MILGCFFWYNFVGKELDKYLWGITLLNPLTRFQPLTHNRVLKWFTHWHVGGHKPQKTLMETISEHPLIGSKVENGWKWKKKLIYHLSRTTILNHCGQCFQRKLDETCIWSHNSYPKPYQISSPSSLWTALPQKASILWILSSLAEVWVLKWFTPKLEVTTPWKPWWKPFQNIPWLDPKLKMDENETKIKSFTIFPVYDFGLFFE